MDTKYELSREIETSDLAEGEVELEVRASPAERAALVRRLGVIALDRLEARVRARHLSGGIYGVRGRLSADVVQRCVISLEPVATSLDEAMSVTWSPDTGWVDEGETLVEVEGARPSGEDGGAIDIGEAVAQQVALALDPYPRAPGAQVPAVGHDGGPDADVRRPFAALAALRRRPD